MHLEHESLSDDSLQSKNESEIVPYLNCNPRSTPLQSKYSQGWTEKSPAEKIPVEKSPVEKSPGGEKPSMRKSQWRKAQY